MEIWFAVGIIFLIIEGISFGLISIWFSLGAFITMFFYKLEFMNQFYIFVATSGIFLIFIRKIAVKKFKGKSKELNRIQNKKVKIEKVEERGGENIYTVFLDGKYWYGISEEKLNLDEIVNVKKIEGNKLILEKFK